MDSPPGSVTSPSTHFAGHDPSGRWAPRSHSYARRASAPRPATDSAIAASTWFQASTWPGTPPVGENHGMAPDASCCAAMLRAVATISSVVRIPGTAGGAVSDRIRRLLAGAAGVSGTAGLAE